MSTVPAGYKRTEVGVIPTDWDVLPMGEVAQCFIGLTYSPRDVKESGTLVLRSSNVQANRLAFSDSVYVDMDIPPRAITQEKDILICVRNGSRQLIGKAALIDKATSGSAFGAFMAVLRSDASEFLFQQFQSNILKKQINDGMGATINQITNKDMAKFKVIWPKKATEQQAIATALTDADAYIESLEQLLTKKRNIKQGAMQELLTGKRRLAGFAGKWVVKRLDALADIRSGGTPSTTQSEFWNGSVLWCTPTDITALKGNKFLFDTSKKITKLGLESSSAELIPANSIVMTTRATIGECAINQVEVSTNQGFKNFIPFANVSVDFLYYLLGTQKQGFISLCGGSTFLEIGKTQLRAYEVTMPSSVEEQTAIASILSDMDAELDALQAKLDKAFALKQGMMQQLLTGKIRLV
jgi:type I restriction enzyme, S subunit